jgi:molybdopterin/thiamine biosynthesis adenylyltransferase
MFRFFKDKTPEKEREFTTRELQATHGRESKCIIKFKHGDLDYLRREVLSDLSNEQFAILLGKREILEEYTFINIIDVKFLENEDYLDQSLTHLNLNKKFIHEHLVEIKERVDIDTIIDVHTHPFSRKDVAFSGVDDRDERDFSVFLDKRFDDISYASIVFSQTEYSARVWKVKNGTPFCEKAIIKTQTAPENINSSDFHNNLVSSPQELSLLDDDNFLNRSTLALGIDTMKLITKNQIVTIVGVGGLGSIVAENLVRNGFSSINLIDHDVVEKSNLNRIVGAFFDDAQNQTYKVLAIEKHLKKITPDVKIKSLPNDVYDSEIEKVIAISDWVFVATDNHSSRFKAQELCFKYFVPLISVGVNITVNDGEIKDMSGEVITVRVGDKLCLNCLGRINQTKVAYDRYPDETIKEILVQKGYVTGKDIKQPAVITLNSILANMAIETLLNQFTLRQHHRPVLVFENNQSMCISEDTYSTAHRNLNCFYCGI